MKKILIAMISLLVSVINVMAASQNVTMKVGETKTLYLPSSVTSKRLKSVSFYSNGVSYVQVTSHTNYSVTIKAVKAFSSKIIIRCDYYYYISRGTFTYLASGAYDYNVMVEDDVVRPKYLSMQAEISVEKGESKDVSVTVTPADAVYTLSWNIANSSIASIGTMDNGKVCVVRGVRSGTTKLTVSTDNGLSLSTKIVVKETQPSVPKLTINDAIGITSIIPSVADVNYSRKFLAGWNSMCVPFAVTQSMLNKVSKNIKVAIVKDVEKLGDRCNIIVKSVASVKAGQPCLVYSPEDVTWNVCLESASLVSAPLTDSDLRGCYKKKVIGKNCYKLKSDGTSFSQTKTDAAVVFPMRCYLITQ